MRHFQKQRAPKRFDGAAKHSERRRHTGLFMPTLYLAFEVLIGFLVLYIVNMGEPIREWNLLFVTIVLLYFVTSSIRRYFNVIRRSKMKGVMKRPGRPTRR